MKWLWGFGAVGVAGVVGVVDVTVRICLSDLSHLIETPILVHLLSRSEQLLRTVL